MKLCTAEPAALDAAAAALRAGRLVAFPTETVYGLGADATDAAAVGRVFAVKGRPVGHPLIAHLADASELDRWALEVGEEARRLADAFWPGPLTMVLRRAPGISPATTGGRDTVGLRVPDHPVALALLERCGVPVAAPSANRFGRVSPTTAPDVLAELGGTEVACVLDGGPCRIGVESTIVELVGATPTLLRPGGVPAEAIEAVLGRPLAAASGPARASGMLASHYAPTVTVELLDTAAALAARARALLGEGRRVAVLGADGAALPVGAVRLGAVGDTDGYARLLYRRLREADDSGADVLLAVLPAPTGLGRAVQDRLRKAAAPRP